MSGSLQLSLLGSLLLGTSDGHAIALPMRKEEALLAYLVAEHHHAHSRESLVGLLWPDSPPDKGRLNLRVTLSRLKKRLDRVDIDAHLHITPLDIQFVVADGWVDIVEFSQNLRVGDRHPHRHLDLCEQCQPAFARAVALYRGTFLDGLFVDECQLFDEWLFMQRERYRVQILDALEALTQFHLRRTEVEQALAYARRQLEIDPLREQTYGTLMQIYLAQGDRSSALQQFERCRHILRAELGIDPSTEILDLHQRILAAPRVESANSAGPVPTAHNSLPVTLTPFVGRQDELALLAQRIHTGNRLITLVGAGGMGKTRLAVEAARQQIAHFKGGVYFVPLASVQATTNVGDAVATALGIASTGHKRTAQEEVIEWLRLQRALLVVDNFEHLLAATPFFLEILSAAPQVVLLVTSREPLGIQAEDLIQVAGLSIPPVGQVNAIDQFSAVRLFIDRTYRIQKQFQLHAENTADVVRICQLVEGRPLALELAAAHTATRSMRAIADAIQTNLDFLATDFPDLPLRHRSLRAIFEQSWAALSPLEQSAFARLSQFRNAFDLESAVAVAGASVPVLTRLLNVHLIQRHGDRERFSIHTLICQFAADKLASSLPDTTTLQRRHADYFLSWLDRHTQILDGVQPMRCVEAILAVLDDVRAAWAWAAKTQAVHLLQRALPVLAKFYLLRGMHAEAERVFELALDHLPEDESRLQGQLLVCLGTARTYQGKVEAAHTALTQGIALAETMKDYATVASGHLAWARLTVNAGSTQDAIQILRRGLAALPPGAFLTERADMLLFGATNEVLLGNRSAGATAYAEVRQILAQTVNRVQEQRLLLYQGLDSIEQNLMAARFYLEQGLALCPDSGDRLLETRLTQGLGFIHARLGNYATALQYHQRGLMLCTEDQDLHQQANALQNLCVCYDYLGNLQEAYRTGQRSVAICENYGLVGNVGYAYLHLGHVMAEMCLYQEAKQALSAAHKNSSELQIRPLIIESDAGLGHVERLLGNRSAALAHVESVLSALPTEIMPTLDEPTRVYLHCYEILQACGDPRAHSVLQNAYAYLQRQAVPLDAEARHQFLNGVPYNRILLAYWQQAMSGSPVTSP